MTRDDVFFPTEADLLEFQDYCNSLLIRDIHEINLEFNSDEIPFDVLETLHV